MEPQILILEDHDGGDWALCRVAYFDELINQRDKLLAKQEQNDRRAVCERCLMNPAHICIGCHQFAERMETSMDPHNDFDKHDRPPVDIASATNTPYRDIVRQRDAASNRAKALRDALCAILSSTGKYPHDIPRLAKEALARDNDLLDAAGAE